MKHIKNANKKGLSVVPGTVVTLKKTGIGDLSTNQNLRK